MSFERMTPEFNLNNDENSVYREESEADGSSLRSLRASFPNAFRMVIGNYQ
jgi:hypothetical protein